MVQWSGGFLAGSVPGEVVNTTFFDQTFFEVFESKCFTDSSIHVFFAESTLTGTHRCDVISHAF